MTLFKERQTVRLSVATSLCLALTAATGIHGSDLTVLTVPSEMPDGALLDDYERRRSKAGSDAVEQWRLAQWCKAHGMSGRARVHALHVIEEKPDHILARRLLRHVRIGQSWIDLDELEEQRDTLKTMASSLRRYEGRLRGIEARSDDATKTDVSRAKQALTSIMKPEACFALSRVLLTSNDRFAQVGIDYLVSHDDVESTQALARLAVLDDRIGVRDQASRALRDRDLFAFIPMLLDWCAGETHLEHDLVTGADGTVLAVERIIMQESGSGLIQTNWTTQVNDNANTRVERAQFRRRGQTEMEEVRDAMVRQDAAIDKQDLDRMIKRQNRQTRDRVARVACLVSTFDDNVGSQATRDDLVGWWYTVNRYASAPDQEVQQVNRVQDAYVRPTIGNGGLNGLNTAGLSRGDSWTTRFTSSTSSTSVPESSPMSNRSGQVFTFASLTSRPAFTGGECLVGSTLVWTDQGPQPIESLRTGDQVLSCDVETGELSYRGVLERTNREPEPLVAIQTESDTITASKGHPFWVVDRGWVMAGDLDGGDVLHSDQESTVIQSVSEIDAIETFNLVVDQNATYFIGRERLLTHDITLRSAATGPVPGQ
ncbi:MAG: polymorphic toxin-type HINT domain-containing protein [Planctomycetota bacterium]